MEEGRLDNVVVVLQSIKNIVDETMDYAYCLKLYNEYVNDPDPNKTDSVSLDDFAKELGIVLA